ncbi:MAG: hypothetical protein QOE45_1265 [Frankiaceae bacterium]|jgi:hypothetical protein|nr:hypothetical protein [Frankiaceae bacterium]
MRIRSVLVGLATLATSMFAAQPPARAATLNATVTITFHVNCFGCGSSSATSEGTCYGVCYINGNLCVGVCHFTNSETTNSEPATCPVAGSMAGTINSWGGSVNFVLTWVGATAVITTSGGVGIGVFAVTSPIGIPCGGPATMTFAGHISGL